MEIGAQRKRVLVLTFDYLRARGGASRIARALVGSLLRRGWGVDVLTQDAPCPKRGPAGERIFSYALPQENTTVPALARYLDLAFSLYDLSMRLTWRNSYDAVHAHHYLAAMALVSLREERHLPTIFTCHGIRKNHFRCYQEAMVDSDLVRVGQEAAMTAAMHVLESRAVQAADHITCVSRSVAEEVESEWPGRRPQIIGNFYCLGNPEPRQPANLPNQILGKRLILFAGRWEFTKGSDVVSKLAERLASRTDLVIVHAGDLIDLPAAERVFHLGYLADRELLWLYKNSTLVLIPSRYEPFGLTSIEAGWNGTPVLANATGGLAEIIRPGLTGWLLDSLDLEVWYQAVLAVFESKLKDISRVETAAYTRSAFAPERFLSQYFSLLSRIMGE